MLAKKNAGRVIVFGSRMRLVDLLSEREIDVLKLLTGGDSNKVIAEKLGISEKTVETHRSNINNRFRELTGHTFPTELLVQMAILSGITSFTEFAFLVIDPPPS